MLFTVASIIAAGHCDAQESSLATAFVNGSLGGWGSMQANSHPLATGADVDDNNGLGAHYEANVNVIGPQIHPRVKVQGNATDESEAEAIGTWEDVLTVDNPEIIDETIGSTAIKVFSPRIRGGIKGNGKIEFAAGVSGVNIQTKSFTGPGIFDHTFHFNLPWTSFVEHGAEYFISVTAHAAADNGLSSVEVSTESTDWLTLYDEYGSKITTSEGLRIVGASGRIYGDAALAADFNEDGAVDAIDLGIWQAGYGETFAALHVTGDADQDFDVDGADFLIWQRQFGSGAPLASNAIAVPEPATPMLLLSGVLATIFGRCAKCRTAPIARSG
jgi:hypothetical protein